MGINKRGDADLRTLLIHGGRTVVRVAYKRQDKHSQWISWIDPRRGKDIPAVAVANKIELFYLPTCSPEQNPDEYPNCDLKAGVHSKLPARNKKQLKVKVLSRMRMLQKKSDRVDRR